VAVRVERDQALQESRVRGEPRVVNLGHLKLEAVRGGLLLHERAERVARDAVGEAGEVLDVLAVEDLAARGEALEEQGAAPSRAA
jgi:hypothetical protein